TPRTLHIDADTRPPRTICGASVVVTEKLWARIAPTPESVVFRFEKATKSRPETAKFARAPLASRRVAVTLTNSLACANGNGRTKTAEASVKTSALAPIPRHSVTTVASE